MLIYYSIDDLACGKEIKCDAIHFTIFRNELNQLNNIAAECKILLIIFHKTKKIGLDKVCHINVTLL